MTVAGERIVRSTLEPVRYLSRKPIPHRDGSEDSWLPIEWLWQSAEMSCACLSTPPAFGLERVRQAARCGLSPFDDVHWGIGRCSIAQGKGCS